MKLFLLAWIPCLALAAWLWIKRPRTYGLANIAEGAHAKGWITRFPETEIPTGPNGQRLYLFAKNSESPDSADIAGINDIPIGIWGDSSVIGSFPGGEEISVLSTPLVIRLLGSSGIDTQPVSINSAVALGDFLVPDAGGYARTLPAVEGTYYVCGRALEAGAAGDNIEFDPTLPYPLVVA